MTEFKSGNVVKSPYGKLEIVTKAHETHIETIPIDSSSVTLFYSKSDSKEIRCCKCTNEGTNQADEECEVCKGTGAIEHINLGYTHCTFIASSVKDYIVDSFVRKVFF